MITIWIICDVIIAVAIKAVYVLLKPPECFRNDHLQNTHTVEARDGTLN